MYVFQLFHRAGIPVPYHDLCYFIAPRTVHTGTAILQLAGYGSGFVEEQYGEAGTVFDESAVGAWELQRDSGSDGLRAAGSSGGAEGAGGGGGEVGGKIAPGAGVGVARERGFGMQLLDFDGDGHTSSVRGTLLSKPGR